MESVRRGSCGRLGRAVFSADCTSIFSGITGVADETDWLGMDILSADFGMLAFYSGEGCRRCFAPVLARVTVFLIIIKKPHTAASGVGFSSISENRVGRPIISYML